MLAASQARYADTYYVLYFYLFFIESVILSALRSSAMPPLALPTFFSRSVESSGTRIVYQADQQRVPSRDGGSALLSSRPSLFGIRVPQRPERALDNGARSRRVTVADISRPKLLYGTGPFAWDFSNSGTWKMFNEDEKIRLESNQNPFIIGDDDDSGQAVTLSDAEDCASPGSVNIIRTSAVSCSQPKTEHVLRLPEEYIADLRSDSTAGEGPLCNGYIMELDGSAVENLDEPLRNNRVAAIIAELEKVGKSCKELSIAIEEEGGEVEGMELDPYDECYLKAHFSYQSSETYNSDESSSPSGSNNIQTRIRREILRASQTAYMTKEDAQRILLERRTDIQESPDLRIVVPNPCTRDSRTLRRASSPIYPCYIQPRPESIEKLRKCLMKQFNAEDLYRPAIPSLLVPGSEFRRPKSIHRLSGPFAKTYEQPCDATPPPSISLKGRSSDKLLVKVLRRAYYDSLVANTPVQPADASGGDPFADPPTDSVQGENEKLDPALTEFSTSVRRKSSISAQLRTIRSSLKKRTSLGTISATQLPSEGGNGRDPLLEPPPGIKTDRNGFRVTQVVDALTSVGKLKRDIASAAQQSEGNSTLRPSGSAKSLGKRRGLSDISNKGPTSNEGVQVYSSSEKQNARRSRRLVASLVLSENAFHHKRSLSIHSAELPHAPRAPPPALRSSRSSLQFRQPFRV